MGIEHIYHMAAIVVMHPSVAQTLSMLSANGWYHFYCNELESFYLKTIWRIDTTSCYKPIKFSSVFLSSSSWNIHHRHWSSLGHLIAEFLVNSLYKYSVPLNCILLLFNLSAGSHPVCTFWSCDLLTRNELSHFHSTDHFGQHDDIGLIWQGFHHTGNSGKNVLHFPIFQERKTKGMC